MLKQIAIKVIMLYRFVKSEPDFLKKLKTINLPGKKILLIGTPIHGNYGDHLIALAECSFVRTHFPDYHLIDCTMPFSKYFFKRIIKSVNKDDIIMISGGGWLGSDWPDNERFVRRILTSYNNNLIVIMPQTVSYKHNDIFQKQGKEIYTRAKKLVFCTRDQRSYDFILSKGFTDKSKAFLMPDFALFYSTDIYNENKSEIINICFRDDVEVSMNPKIREMIFSYLNEKGYKYKTVTTNINGYVIPLKKRLSKTESKLREISYGRLLITDRLHAMIMAALTGTPCLAFDNSTHKVSGVYKWITNRDNIMLLSNNDDPIKAIEVALNYSPSRDGLIVSSKWLEMLEQKIRKEAEV